MICNFCWTHQQHLDKCNPKYHFRSISFPFTSKSAEKGQRSWRIYFQILQNVWVTCTKFQFIWPFADDFTIYIQLLSSFLLMLLKYFNSTLRQVSFQNSRKSKCWSNNCQITTFAWIIMIFLRFYGHFCWLTKILAKKKSKVRSATG